ncbi:hypothetical protein [Streptomyces sp. NBRC 109706]|uniref:hypothetical protein n=1 Tax=Streptomyces sp. NBRC 109706 TaxID=1550035 RepID=UPI00078454C5|nr:hypothetical protein [Streptomyces sp. NBRC 109706]
MKLIRLVGECEEGECPTLYSTDRGTLAVQGDLLADHGIRLSDGEGVVEIPISLLRKAVADGVI